MENEQADVGRDGPDSQARTGTGENSFSLFSYHEQDWQPYPVDPYSAVGDGHTYKHNTALYFTSRYNGILDNLCIVAFTTILIMYLNNII